MHTFGQRAGEKPVEVDVQVAGGAALTGRAPAREEQVR